VLFRSNDLLEVSAGLNLVKSASLIFEQSIRRQDEILSKATIRIACLDANTMRPQLIPDFLKQALNNE
ncbi:MAG: tol-pal system-associated acyl-CoA thioesterase, partial [Methyloprofundus sp.]|nr:tol-pal system-associated acyl-CoA thioesterase [Methyloprofundus sp.]